jgi:transcriptional regulator of acetoin/glycerol metabolism
VSASGAEHLKTRTLDSGAEPGGLVHQPQLALVFQAERPFEPSIRWSLAAVDVCHVGRGPKVKVGNQWDRGTHRLKIEIPDSGMSSNHARLVRDADQWIIEDAGSKNGTRINGTRETRVALTDGDVIEIGQSFFVFRLALPVRMQDPPMVVAASSTPPAPGLATILPALATRFDQLVSVARSDKTILLGGESGTGKELVARAIHELTSRRGAFVALNCGAIPAALVESQLFGHKRGAFSGATEEQRGLVRAADGGTLFLDEIGDLPLGLQPAFLRVLQEHEVLPVGGTRPVPVDIRLVAATHHSLPELVDAGRFRADLFARIKGFVFELPPFRQRREDLGLIVATLLRRLDARPDTVFDVKAARALVRYHWPLNIRELEQCLSIATTVTRDRTIRIEHLAAEIRPFGDGATRGARPPEPSPEDRRQQLVALLREHDGNVAAVARALGKDRTQIYRWLKQHGIDPDSKKK